MFQPLTVNVFVFFAKKSFIVYVSIYRNVGR